MEETADKNSNLDRLARGLSSTERRELLNKMDSADETAIDEFFAQKTKKDDRQNMEEKLEFTFKLRKEPFYRRFWVWLKSFFSDESIEEIYNETLLKELAKDIEHRYPDLIVYKRKLLYNTFYGKLVMLQKAADYFKPYIKIFEKNPGGFYVELARIIMPGTVESIEEESDPYQLSFKDELPEESIRELRQTMLSNLNSIPQDNQRDMYQFAQMVCWLQTLVKLPLERMIRKFGLSSDQARACLFYQTKDDFMELAKVICNYIHIDERILEAFVLFMEDNEIDPNLSNADSNADKEHAFREVSESEISIIEMFVTTTPMEKLAKVITGNYLYTVRPAGGGEKWSEQFSDTIKKKFERRLKSWKQDQKKEKLKQKLVRYFKLPDFPQFPFTPWTNLGNDFTVKTELSVGFVNFFVKQKFSEYMTVLKGLSREGAFSVKENQRQLSAAMDNFEQTDNWLDSLADKLCPTGEYGGELSRYNANTASDEINLPQVNKILAEIDAEASRIIKGFNDVCKDISLLLEGFISGATLPPYGSIINLDKILRAVGDVYEKIKEMITGFTYAAEITKSLQEIESTGK